MRKFEIGKRYEWDDPGYGSVRVVKRTDKTITVMNDSNVTWRMLVRHDDEGNEAVTDSSVPKRWRDAFTCNARWEV